MIFKTTVLKGNNPKRNWHLIDLEGKTLGRVSVEIANLLMGKNKPTFSYHRDDGDYVVAINSDKIKVTGKKLTDKIYYRYTNFPGGLRSLTLKELLAKDSRKVIHHGVNGMLPKNHLRKKRMSRLKIFAGGEHTFADKLTTK